MLFEIFYNLLTAPRTVFNTYAQVAQAQSCANHVQHIERLFRASVMLHATWYEGTAQLLSLTEFKSHLFELYCIGWTIKPMKEGRKLEYPEKTPDNSLEFQSAVQYTTAQHMQNLLLVYLLSVSLTNIFFFFFLMRHNSSSVCMGGITYVYFDMIFAFYGYILFFFLFYIYPSLLLSWMFKHNC